uniref:Secreted protein n=1 Tax=Echinococcus granulosus TaxID=6210 RepID=A0A068WYZ4_ECHGR|nr:hypothetical protein EgrG_002044600 [Echinococcus granulosus]
MCVCTFCGLVIVLTTHCCVPSLFPCLPARLLAWSFAPPFVCSHCRSASVSPTPACIALSLSLSLSLSTPQTFHAVLDLIEWIYFQSSPPPPDMPLRGIADQQA